MHIVLDHHWTCYIVIYLDERCGVTKADEFSVVCQSNFAFALVLLYYAPGLVSNFQH